MRKWLGLAAFVFAASFIWPGESPAAPSPSPTPIAVTAAMRSNDPAVATQAWLDSVPAAQRARSDAYFEGGYWLILWNFLLSVAVMWFLLISGISVRLRNFAERITRSRLLQTALYAIPFLVVTGLLSFPLNVYQDFIRDHQYGLSTQSFPSWLADQMKLGVVALIGLTLFLTVLYAVFRRAPRTWWIWAVGVLALFSMLVTFLFPVYIAPLTNKYTPLQAADIRDPILQMARANEIPVDQVYQFDASRQSNRVSANVAGFFGTTRIALNDNLLKQCTLPEIRAVMAHEMGHYVLNHALKLTVFITVINFAVFGLVYLLFNAGMRRWGARWQLRGIADPAALPLLIAALSTLTFFATPLNNSTIRSCEREADAFGMNTSREPEGMAKVALKLGSYRKLNPGALEEIIFFDHPSGRARIRMAMDWRAAHLPAGAVP